MFLFFIAIYLGYFTCLHFYFYGWKKLSSFESESKKYTALSVIIPFKDEGNHLHELIGCLKKQSLPENFYRLIFVDDHSVDTGVELILAFQKEFGNVCLVKNEGKGKKAAIQTGLSKANSDYILTLDADIQVSKLHLETISQYISLHAPDLLIGPVSFASNAASFFAHFQGLEFQSLAVSTAACVHWNRPIMCNGANLVFNRKKLKDDYLSIVKSDLLSGDDMFLLEYAKRHQWKIDYLKNKNAIAWIQPLDIRSFFRQRKRWSSKALHYRDPDIIISGVLVALFNLTLIVNIAFAFGDHKWGLLLLVLLLVKLVAEGALLIASGEFFQTRKSMPYLPFVVLLVPFYVVFTMVGSIFIPADWRN